MKKILLFFIFLSIGVGLLIWTLRFIGWQEIKTALLLFTGWQGLIILLLTVLMLFTGMWKWKVILKSQGHNLTSGQLFGPYLAGYAMVYLFPMAIFGGEIFKGYVLKERFSVPWAKGIASVIIDKVLEMTSFLVTIFAGLVFFLLKIGLPPRNLGIILVPILVFVSGSIGFFYFKSFRKESMAKLFTKFFNNKKLHDGEPLDIEKEIFKFFKPKKRVFWEGFGLAFLRVAVTWMKCWVFIFLLGKSVNFFPVLSVLGFRYLALMIPIPTALGSHEAIQVFAFGALGLGASIAPAFTMIQRGAELIIAFIGIIISFKLGMGLLQTSFFKKIEHLIDSKLG